MTECTSTIVRPGGRRSASSGAPSIVAMASIPRLDLVSSALGVLQDKLPVQSTFLARQSPVTSAGTRNRELKVATLY